jgi:hypothetical protein
LKYILIVTILLGLNLNADYIKQTIAACNAEETVAQLQEYAKKHKIEKGDLELELWLMKHECQILDKKTKIEVLEYTGKKKEHVKLLLKESGDIVFAHHKGIQIEQPGQKNIIYKF